MFDKKDKNNGKEVMVFKMVMVLAKKLNIEPKVFAEAMNDEDATYVKEYMMEFLKLTLDNIHKKE